MDAFKVEFDFIEFEQGLKAAAKDQFPFATARALTWTAKDAQFRIRKALPERFILRSNFLTRGITVKKATKTALYAEVGTAEGGGKEGRAGKLLGEQILGVRRTEKGTRSIPTKVVRPTAFAKVSKSKFPAALKGKGGKRKPFFAVMNNGHKVLAQRASKKRLPIKILYDFHSSIQLKPHDVIKSTVEETVADKWQENMVKSLEDAVKSPK